MLVIVAATWNSSLRRRRWCPQSKRASKASHLAELAISWIEAPCPNESEPLNMTPDILLPHICSPSHTRAHVCADMHTNTYKPWKWLCRPFSERSRQMRVFACGSYKHGRDATEFPITVLKAKPITFENKYLSWRPWLLITGLSVLHSSSIRTSEIILL